MSDLLRLLPEHPDVVALTVSALVESRSSDPELLVKCSGCGATLARAGRTASGPLWVSTWQEPRPAPVPVNDEVMPVRRFRRVTADTPITLQGDGTEDEPQSVVALLALPAGMPPDYPDLLVRCSRHGDEVVARGEALEHLRSGGTWRLRPSGPRRDYAPPDWDGFAAEVHSAARNPR